MTFSVPIYCNKFFLGSILNSALSLNFAIIRWLFNWNKSQYLVCRYFFTNTNVSKSFSVGDAKSFKNYQLFDYFHTSQSVDFPLLKWSIHILHFIGDIMEQSTFLVQKLGVHFALELLDQQSPVVLPLRDFLNVKEFSNYPHCDAYFWTNPDLSLNKIPLDPFDKEYPTPYLSE